MEQSEIKRLLNTGFVVVGQQFEPLAYICEVNEPFYGCEERTEDILYGSVVGFNAAGRFELPISETELESCVLDDNMWVGYLQMPEGGKLFAYRPAGGSLTPLEVTPLLEAMGIDRANE